MENRILPAVLATIDLKVNPQAHWNLHLPILVVNKMMKSADMRKTIARNYFAADICDVAHLVVRLRGNRTMNKEAYKKRSGAIRTSYGSTLKIN